MKDRNAGMPSKCFASTICFAYIYTCHTEVIHCSLHIYILMSGIYHQISFLCCCIFLSNHFMWLKIILGASKCIEKGCILATSSFQLAVWNEITYTKKLGVKSCNDTKLMIRLRINMKSCDTYNTLPCSMNEEGRCNLLLTFSEYFLRPGNFWKNFVCKGDMIGGINIKIKKSIITTR